MKNRSPWRYQLTQPPDDWLGRLARLNLHFGRFLRDASGIVCIAAALMSLLALWGLTGGVVLTPWSAFLATWFGWGSYLLVAALVLAGLWAIRRGRERFRWGRLFALEAAALLTLGILSIIGGNSLVRADAGLDGGRLGWGIAYFPAHLAGTITGAIVLSLLWLLMAAFGLGLWGALEASLRRLAGESEATGSAPSLAAEQAQSSEATGRTAVKAAKPSTPLPREFRPRLKAPQPYKERARTAERDEDLPSLGILLSEQAAQADERTINQTAGMIMKTLSEFGIPATVIGYRIGPAVTQFAVQPGYIKRQGVSECFRYAVRRIFRIASFKTFIVAYKRFSAN